MSSASDSDSSVKSYQYAHDGPLRLLPGCEITHAPLGGVCYLDATRLPKQSPTFFLFDQKETGSEGWPFRAEWLGQPIDNIESAIPNKELPNMKAHLSAFVRPMPGAVGQTDEDARVRTECVWGFWAADTTEGTAKKVDLSLYNSKKGYLVIDAIPPDRIDDGLYLFVQLSTKQVEKMFKKIPGEIGWPSRRDILDALHQETKQPTQLLSNGELTSDNLVCTYTLYVGLRKPLTPVTQTAVSPPTTASPVTSRIPLSDPCSSTRKYTSSQPKRGTPSWGERVRQPHVPVPPGRPLNTLLSRRSDCPSKRRKTLRITLGVSVPCRKSIRRFPTPYTPKP